MITKTKEVLTKKEYFESDDGLKVSDNKEDIEKYEQNLKISKFKKIKNYTTDRCNFIYNYYEWNYFHIETPLDLHFLITTFYGWEYSVWNDVNFRPENFVGWIGLKCNRNPSSPFVTISVIYGEKLKKEMLRLNNLSKELLEVL